MGIVAGNSVRSTGTDVHACRCLLLLLLFVCGWACTLYRLGADDEAFLFCSFYYYLFSKFLSVLLLSCFTIVVKQNSSVWVFFSRECVQWGGGEGEPAS